MYTIYSLLFLNYQIHFHFSMITNVLREKETKMSEISQIWQFTLEGFSWVSESFCTMRYFTLVGGYDNHLCHVQNSPTPMIKFIFIGRWSSKTYCCCCCVVVLYSDQVFLGRKLARSWNFSIFSDQRDSPITRVQCIQWGCHHASLYSCSRSGFWSCLYRLGRGLYPHHDTVLHYKKITAIAAKSPFCTRYIHI